MGFIADALGFGGGAGEILAGGKGDFLDIWGFQSEKKAKKAAKGAAETQVEAQMAGLEEFRRQFDISREDMAPWMEAGTGALGTQRALLGQQGAEAQQSAFDAFRQSPGQAFLQARGQKNLLANASAIGGLGGGNVKEALVQQGVGFAQQDFGNYYNRLAGLSSTGQQTSTQLGQLGSQFAGQAATQLGNVGAARASGILGSQQASAQQTQQMQGTAATVGKFFLSDRTKKENIEDLNLKKCYEAMITMPLKSWKYLEETGLDQDIHYGPMTQEAPEMITQGNMINIHDELMMIVGGLQYMKQEGMIKCH